MALKQVSVTANYLGTDAKTAEENVTTVLEREINGTERVVYMSSQTTNNMAQLQPNFPPGLKATIGLDNTLFVAASVDEAFKTLTEAIALVFLVIFIFLQDWRTTIIPAIAIPVSLIGAMAFAFVFGFTLNQLTIFGIILATGLVVDDGIVVVEAIAAKLEQGMKPLQAALDAMEELTGAIIATSVVMFKQWNANDWINHILFTITVV